MLFNSVQYAMFLLVVVAVYWGVARSARPWVLLVSSYAFYATWDWRYTLLLLADSLAAFALGRAVGASDDPARRKNLVRLMVVANLVVLGFFKYFNFFVDSVDDLASTFGLSGPNVVLRVALPVGISFFTFQLTAYVIDVGRRELEPTRNLVTFLVFGSYFPHLLAGPIMRAKRMLPQFENLPRQVDQLKWNEGLELILIGLFQKVAVADVLATFTGPTFARFAADSSSVSTFDLWVATLGSLIQFVLDFAGYSNIARGTSKLLGIELPYNFRQPLTRSKDFQDFWRREHMTLMAWFRDYVYRPMHRRRAPRWRNEAALVIVFMLSGLWHGAAWVWLIWGTALGVVLVAERNVVRLLGARRRGDPTRPAALGAADQVDSPVPGPAGGTAAVGVLSRPASASRARAVAIGGTVYVFVVAALSLAFVRSGTVSGGLSALGHLFVPSSGGADLDDLLLLLYSFAALLVVDARQVAMEDTEGRPDPPTTRRAVFFGVMVLAIVVFSGQPAEPFVYFQF